MERLNIAFHSNQISVRGTEVAMYDYADYNEKLLGNTSIILAKSPDVWPYSHEPAIEKFKNRFKVFFYKETSEIEQILDDNKIDVLYAIKAGIKDEIISSKRKTVVHSVFQYHEPHGNVYAYVSEWLGKQYNAPYVPHMVTLPDCDENLRAELGIPSEAIVYGRHGGRETFDIPFVKSAIPQIVKENPNIYFLFLNTDRFCEENPNVIHLPQNSDMVYKTKFINSCDAMIHARQKGESFGLAIGEFSIKNKPVIMCSQGIDQAHFYQLRNKGIYYSNISEFVEIITDHDFLNDKTIDWNGFKEYTPENVMNKFNEVFLKQ